MDRKQADKTLHDSALALVLYYLSLELLVRIRKGKCSEKIDF